MAARREEMAEKRDLLLEIDAAEKAKVAQVRRDAKSPDDLKAMLEARQKEIVQRMADAITKACKVAVNADQLESRVCFADAETRNANWAAVVVQPQDDKQLLRLHALLMQRAAELASNLSAVRNEATALRRSIRLADKIREGDELHQRIVAFVTN
jgi:hypothetical protein